MIRAIPGSIETDDGTLTTWAVGSSRKTQSAPVAIGSIDQALLSQVKNRHAWMRSLWLARHLLIIDEVHASDTYTGELMLRLVQEHMRAGGYVLAMSATLGEALRAKLENRAALYRSLKRSRGTIRSSHPVRIGCRWRHRAAASAFEWTATRPRSRTRSARLKMARRSSGLGPRWRTQSTTGSSSGNKACP